MKGSKAASQNRISKGDQRLRRRSQSRGSIAGVETGEFMAIS
jgi:hypothetical protein